MKQTPDQAAHEEQRNEDGNEREAHRDDGETDLPRAFERGLHRRIALLHEAKNVFDDHDRIIHDEADRDGHSHEREIVERVVAEIHHAKGAGESERHGDAGDERRPEAPEKKKHDHDDERDAQQQGELHVLDG